MPDLLCETAGKEKGCLLKRGYLLTFVRLKKNITNET